MTEQSDIPPVAGLSAWVRAHPVLFGILISVVFGLFLLIAVLYDAQLVESFMTQNVDWLRLFAYTVVMQGLLIKYCPPRPPLIAYWSVFGALLMLHLACSIWFILKVMPLLSIHYVIFGAFETLAVYSLLCWGVQHVTKGYRRP